MTRLTSPGTSRLTTLVVFGRTEAVIDGSSSINVHRFPLAYSVLNPFGVEYWLWLWGLAA